MPTRDPATWMWAEACSMLEQAERLHRQFFRLNSPRGATTAWEPPANVFEDDESYTIVVALPGVAEESIEVLADSSSLIVRANSEAAFGQRTRALGAPEITYG